MSFSSEAKAELCRLPLDKKNIALAECYGVLLYCNSFSPREVRIITASAAFAERLPRLWRRAFGLGFDTCSPEKEGGKHSLAVTEREKLRKIFDAFGGEIDATLSHHVNFGVLEEPGAMEAFVRGAFLAGGSVTDPEKRSHLELATPHRNVSREMISILLDLGFEPRETERRGNFLLYFKKADAIADFLTQIGAPVAAMSVMTAKVDKEMRNLVTRRINCDTANADKTVSAAQEQLEAIRKLVRAWGGLDALPEPLQDAAMLRIANPEVSLADLARLSDPPVTKSCLGHRLKKIQELAEKEHIDMKE
jgi:DNA-binding protein WhiA